jgi:hypothetical protein
MAHDRNNKGLSLDINGFIFTRCCSTLLHWRPIRYVHSFTAAARA